MDERLKFTPGTYEGVAHGNNGPLKLEVTFSEDRIKRIEIGEHVETEGISLTAIEQLPHRIVENQTLKVDAISGATKTSNGIIEAITKAAEAADADIQALRTREPEVITEKEDIEMTVDVVVVGSGGAGLAAAAAAHQNGADVVVIEKQGIVGGSTALSGGGISATDTRFQRELGIEDSKENWLELWKERQATSNPDGMYPDYDFVDYYMDEAVKTTEWLVDYVGHDYGEVTGFGVDPVPRIHFPKTDQPGRGALLIQNMNAFLFKEDVPVLTETSLKELLTDEEENIVGLLAEGKNGTVTIHANKVILATGGYAKNEELISEHIPQLKGSAAISAAAPGSTGDGIIQAMNHGATLYEEPWVIGLGVTSLVPGTGSLGFDWSKVYVNGDGHRFMNEGSHYAIVTNQIANQDKVWVVLDSSQVNETVVEAIETVMPSNEVAKGETFSELAEAMNIPAETLERTMLYYNQGAEKGQDDMGKATDFLVPVAQAPYYAIRIYPLTMGTFAGVKTDEAFRVLDKEGSVIENLYATGETANKRIYNQVYMSGSAVQFALTSGRIAGEDAAKVV